MSSLQIAKVLALSLFVIGLPLGAALSGRHRHDLYADPRSFDGAASSPATPAR
jgi:hypothetical protein